MKSMYGDEVPLMKMRPNCMIYSSRLNNQTYVATSSKVAIQSFSIAEHEIISVKNKK